MEIGLRNPRRSLFPLSKVQRWAWGLGAVLALATAGCNRCSEKPDASKKGSIPPTSADRSPPVEKGASPNEPETQPGTLGRPAYEAPKPPTTPPELVACAKNEFYRITRKSLDVFEVAPTLPPPHIRGSSVARLSAKHDLKHPSNLLILPSGEAVVLAPKQLYSYELGQSLRFFDSPLESTEGLRAWAAGRRSVWLSTPQGRTDGQVTSMAVPRRDGSAAALDAQTHSLPDWDSRLLAMLADGSLLYSSAEGLIRLAEETPTPAGAVGEDVKAIFPDPDAEKYWTYDGLRTLERKDWKHPEREPSQVTLPGSLIDTAYDERRLAVLSLELAREDYQPTITIYEDGKETARRPVAPTPARLGQPDLDLCLLSGRPMVVVGGAQWLQLLDLDSPRLLAEW